MNIKKCATKVGVALFFLLSGLMSTTALAQQETVSGTVTNAQTGEPISDVNVVVRGTNMGTATNAEGYYSLQVPSLQDTLVFSFIGYESEVVPIISRTEINISLEPHAIVAEELVVVGYGQQQEANLTGAVGTVSSESLENRAVANLTQALQGKISGLNVRMSSGSPTSEPLINIRGYGSINGSSPLIVVDGVVVESFNSVDPDNIKSISVLKDAASAAVYGSRAAYGVILITTKDGQKGPIQISVSSQFSWASPILNLHPIKNPHTYVTLWNRATMRASNTLKFKEPYINGTKAWVKDPTKENAWEVVDGELQHYAYNNFTDKVITDYAPARQYRISLSGGSDKVNYYLSASMLKQSGYLRYNNTQFNRKNVLMKIHYQPFDWLEVGGEIRYNMSDYDKPHFYYWDVNINSLARMPTISATEFPDLEYYLKPGDHDKFAKYIGMPMGKVNFLPYLLQGGRTTFTNTNTYLTARVIVTPMEGLEIHANFTPHIFHRNWHDVASKVDLLYTQGGIELSRVGIAHGFSVPDYIADEAVDNRSYSLNLYARYTTDFTAAHHLEVMAGYDQELTKNYWVRAQAYDLLSRNVGNIHATTGTEITDGSTSALAIRGFFYSVRYNYKDRYILAANGRYDGTSRFPEESRWGFFPSFSAAWRISNESFMDATDSWLDNLKIRASWGTLGNQDIGGYYPYIPALGSGSAAFILHNSRIPMVTASGLVSPALTWETAISKNLGLDFAIFDGRFSGSFNIYSRITKDMLLSKTYPNILGANPPLVNAANLETTGWEVSLEWSDNINSDWSFDIRLALSDYTSKITKYSNPNGNIYDYYVGKELGTIWGYKTVGLFQSEQEIAKAPVQTQLGSNWKPGDVRYADLNGDGKVGPGKFTLEDHGDLRVIGNRTPRYHFGVTLGIHYNNWGLTTFFQGIGKRDVYPDPGNWTWFFPFNSLYLSTNALDTWSEDNRDAYFYGPTIVYNTKKNVHQQTRYLQNAAYIRLKTLRLSYSLPIDLLEEIGLRSAQIYLMGTNIWEYSPIHKPLHPQTIDATLDGDVSGAIEFPFQRTYTVGVEVNI